MGQKGAMCMKLKSVWLSWLYLFILSAVLGFIPAAGFLKAVFVMVAVGFFVPGFILLTKADHRDDQKTIRLVRNIAIFALILATVLIMLNMLSATMTKAWGDVFYGMLVIFSAPLICGQYWVLTLFGWACLMVYGTTQLKKKEK